MKRRGLHVNGRNHEPAEQNAPHICSDLEKVVSPRTHKELRPDTARSCRGTAVPSKKHVRTACHRARRARRRSASAQGWGRVPQQARCGPGGGGRSRARARCLPVRSVRVRAGAGARLGVEAGEGVPRPPAPGPWPRVAAPRRALTPCPRCARKTLGPSTWRTARSPTSSG